MAFLISSRHPNLPTPEEFSTRWHGLPIELVHEILLYMAWASGSDARNLCLVSSSVQRLVLPALYHTVTLTTAEQVSSFAAPYLPKRISPFLPLSAPPPTTPCPPHVHALAFAVPPKRPSLEQTLASVAASQAFSELSHLAITAQLIAAHGHWLRRYDLRPRALMLYHHGLPLPVAFTAPFFSNVTHLCTSTLTGFRGSSLADLPALTHVSLCTRAAQSPTVLRDTAAALVNVLHMLPRLQMMVFSIGAHGHGRQANIEAWLGALSSALRHPRFYFLPYTRRPRLDWHDATRGRADVFEHARIWREAGAEERELICARMELEDAEFMKLKRSWEWDLDLIQAPGYVYGKSKGDAEWGSTDTSKELLVCLYSRMDRADEWAGMRTGARGPPSAGYTYRQSLTQFQDVWSPSPPDDAKDEKVSIAEAVDVVDVNDAIVNPGELTFEEDTAGGMGRHLGVFSCTMLIVGQIIGTGIFSTPSSIYTSVGSVGASLMLWVLGFALSFCGLFVWLEFGAMFPRSGGEKVYLEAAWTKPKYLSTVLFAANNVILNFSSANCIVFADNVLEAAGGEAGIWPARGIALGLIGFVVLVHGFTPRLGVHLMNALTVFKIVILLLIVVAGWVVLGGGTRVQDPHANFRNAFAGSSRSGNDAPFKVIFSYSGWSNVNYVMNNVRNPVRTLKIAGPLGLGITTVLYLLANVSYFAAASKDEIANSGVVVAALFFRNVFTPGAEKALTNVMNSAFAASRVNQELAKEGIPFPISNRFWASNWPTGKSPIPGLLAHLIMTVIVIIAPPPNVAYPFILDVQGYPLQVIYLMVVLGLFWLRWTKPEIVRPFKVWLPFAFFFLACAVFLLVAPFLRPPGGIGDTPPLPYYLYCLVGIAVLAASVVYWALWRIVFPKLFGYTLEMRKDILADGTVVTLFEHIKTS
ncbi:hypothetical protein EVG20_g6076 [Dentipellis fragilis]|uniref:Uncharacterized protein n=1 Tax=Dentipellis fragilis TaxID=205917 RepID=A0A4Y9YQF1_9AGAM|nr:hypothetical protein EVG20_g6076 [Dentipellis fragilis]